MIMSCTCKHVYQDKRYGKGQRVHNPTAGGTKGTYKDGFACTVCGRAKTGAPVATIKKK